MPKPGCFLTSANLLRKTLATQCEVGIGIELAVVALADNRQHRNFKHDGVQPRASYSDLNIRIAAFGACHAYRAALQRKSSRKSTKSLLMNLRLLR